MNGGRYGSAAAGSAADGGAPPPPPPPSSGGTPPTPPPRGSAGGATSQNVSQNNASANARGGRHARQEQWLRIRADSVGSTRGAFGTTARGEHRHPPPHQQHQHQQQPTGGGDAQQGHGQHGQHGQYQAQQNGHERGHGHGHGREHHHRRHRHHHQPNNSSNKKLGSSTAPPVPSVTVTSPSKQLAHQGDIIEASTTTNAYNTNANANANVGPSSSAKKRRGRRRKPTKSTDSSEQSPFKNIGSGGGGGLGGGGGSGGGGGRGGQQQQQYQLQREDFNLSDAAAAAAAVAVDMPPPPPSIQGSGQGQGQGMIPQGQGQGQGRIPQGQGQTQGRIPQGPPEVHGSSNGIGQFQPSNLVSPTTATNGKGSSSARQGMYQRQIQAQRNSYQHRQPQQHQQQHQQQQVQGYQQSSMQQQGPPPPFAGGNYSGTDALDASNDLLSSHYFNSPPPPTTTPSSSGGAAAYGALGSPTPPGQGSAALGQESMMYSDGSAMAGSGIVGENLFHDGSLQDVAQQGGGGGGGGAAPLLPNGTTQQQNLQQAARGFARTTAPPRGQPLGQQQQAPLSPLGPEDTAQRQSEINAFAAIASGAGSRGGSGGSGGGYGSTGVSAGGYNADAAAGGGGGGGGGAGSQQRQHQLQSQFHHVSIDQGSWNSNPQPNEIRTKATSPFGGMFSGLVGRMTGTGGKKDSAASATVSTAAVDKSITPTTSDDQPQPRQLAGHPDDEDDDDDDDDDVYGNVSEDTDDRNRDDDQSSKHGGWSAYSSDAKAYDDGYDQENWFWRTWHTCVYDSENPEFSSTQQFTWAVLLGIFFGVFTALWGQFIEFCVEIVWVDVPEKLLEWGVFTDLDGHFPLPHYMWVCPAVFGGILAWITVKLPKAIPDQNEWIETLHRVGVLRHDTFLSIILTATGGMASGLSLGPELPLVLSSGMVGSYLALKTHQSILSGRVLNLTAGSAAIAGFFGFPMAGAMFVLELPHQMGLQYFEALSPATIASIVAVLVNRMVTGNEIKGYFNYPWLTSSLPSHLFYIAVIYGLYGAAIGIAYAEGVKKLKTWTHDWFHHHEDHVDHGHSNTDPNHDDNEDSGEHKGLLSGKKKSKKNDTGAGPGLVLGKLPSMPSFGIKHEPTRAAVVGVLAGAATGVICMFVPHDLFWGEAQLQTLIDKGKTPLPFFGEGDEPTAIMTAYGYCMIDPDDEYSQASGFGIGCAATFAITKTITIGLSIGTGIIGGHFWGPLFIGCAASHFFTDLMIIINQWIGLGFEALAMYPCVAILCIMGSTHVVTFRAHLAIMLILTLTINTFEGTGGDYSAVFPLLVVSCFVSLMITRSHIFYKQQRCRGDIIASPEVLCEPFKEGTPEYPQHEMHYMSDESGSWYNDDGSSTYGDGTGTNSASNEDSTSLRHRAVPSETSAEDIEREFLEMQQRMSGSLSRSRTGSAMSQTSHQSGIPKPRTPTPDAISTNEQSKRIDEILARPLDPSPRSTRAHRRVQSTDDAMLIPDDESETDQDASDRARTLSMANAKTPPRGHKRTSSMGASPHRRYSSMGPGMGHHRRTSSIDKNIRALSTRDRTESTGSRSGTPTQGVLARVNSYGEMTDFQPSLMNQARSRASSVNRISRPGPSGRHSRSNSNASGSMAAIARQSMGEAAGALTQDDLEREFNAAVHMMSQGGKR